MDSLELIRRLHQHRTWVNAKLIDAVGSLTEDQPRQTFTIGQGSLWRSMLHLYAAEYVWLEALLGNETGVVPGDLPGKIPGNQEAEGGITGWEDLKNKWADLNRRWDDYLSSLTPESLDEMVYRTRTISGQTRRLGTRRADVLLHVCTHAHYTTAQVVNMLRQLGVENPSRSHAHFAGSAGIILIARIRDKPPLRDQRLLKGRRQTFRVTTG